MGMELGERVQVAPVEMAGALAISDLKEAMAAGWSDFWACPVYGLFFAGFYVAAGLLLAYVLTTRGNGVWLIPAAAGFPLLAPFVAVGLYEVSRRREAGLAMNWRVVLGALRGHGDEQILSVGVIVFVSFAFWLMVAHGIFAVFLAESGMGSESLEFLRTGSGQAMLLVGSMAGAIMAFAFYALTVFSLPMLVDREVDFLTAMITSLTTVRANIFVALVWAGTIAVILFAAMVPFFLGLLVALPVLGHATWHLYRPAVPPA